MTARQRNHAIHTDQVGSLNRPAELLAARRQARAGTLSRDALRAVEDDAIRTAISEQVRTGIGVLSEGEMRRDGWQTDLSEAVSGFTKQYRVEPREMPDGTVRDIELHTKYIESRLRKQRHLLSESLPLLKREAGAHLFKVTMPSPAYTYKNSYQPGLTDAAYPEREGLREDLREIYRGEMEYLAAEQVPYVQLDEGFASYIVDGWEGRLRAGGMDPRRQLEEDIAVENELWDILAGTGAIRAAHLCRSNRTRGGETGSYERLAEHLFGALHVDRFLLEYDTERAGGFEPLRFVPKGAMVVLGLVSSKYAQLEDPDELLRRIEQAAKFCPVDQLALSAQCGFGGSEDKNHMSVSEQWRKFELIVTTAAKVWP